MEAAHHRIQRAELALAPPPHDIMGASTHRRTSRPNRMLDLLTPGHHGSSPVDVLIQVATLGASLLIAAGLRFALDAWRRKRTQHPPKTSELP
jgi:hypothetical protein